MFAAEIFVQICAAEIFLQICFFPLEGGAVLASRVRFSRGVLLRKEPALPLSAHSSSLLRCPPLPPSVLGRRISTPPHPTEPRIDLARFDQWRTSAEAKTRYPAGFLALLSANGGILDNPSVPPIFSHFFFFGFVHQV
jgi:hypothetical protein